MQCSYALYLFGDFVVVDEGESEEAEWLVQTGPQGQRREQVF